MYTNKINNNIVEKPYRGDVYYGDIVWVNLGKPCGSEQGGERPVLVVSNDKNNLHSSVVNILPISSSQFKKDHKAYLPTHVPISPQDQGVSGIKIDSIIMCEQPDTIDKSRIIRKTGHISNKYIINALNKAILIQFNAWNFIKYFEDNNMVLTSVES